MTLSRRGEKWTVRVKDPEALGGRRWVGTFETREQAAAAEQAAKAAQAGAELLRLRQRVSELERRNAELHVFSAALAHEVQARLLLVERYAAALAEQLDDSLDESARQDLEAMMRGTARARTLIGALLQQARASEQPPSRGRVDLAAVVGDCLVLLGPEIAARGAGIWVSPLPVVQGDASLLTSVLENVLDNALRYGPRAGGTIRVAANREPSAWRVAVDSDGAPMSATERAEIFEPFRRGSGERRSAGLGIGLAICRTIVERHGGLIGVEPLENGNRLFFTLPD